jgi:HK97 family phage major capsid protein
MNAYLQEANALTASGEMTKEKRARLDYLLAQAKLDKKGSNLEQREAARRVWSAFVKDEKAEARDQQVGQTTISYSTLAGGGGLVPTDFFESLPMAMAQHSPLFDEESVTFVRTPNARPMLVPFASDVETVASVVNENTSVVATDIPQIGQKVLGGFSYRSPMWKVSREFDTDVAEFVNTTSLFERFASDRIARGAGADLLTNSSAGKPYGLLPSLLALNATTTAVGSATNDGTANTGANSIGSQDLTRLFYSVPAPYRASDKAAWLMNDSTALFLGSVLNKMGSPILDLNASTLSLYAKPVKIDNGMPNIGASATPIAFGDFSYWATRADSGYIKKFTQRYADTGQVGFRAFVRIDGCLLFSDASSPCPIRLLQNHS